MFTDGAQKKGLDNYFAPAAVVRGKIKDDVGVFASSEYSIMYL